MSNRGMVYRKWTLWAVGVALSIASISGVASADSTLRPHTTIPVVFPRTLNSSKLKPGDTFTLKTTQTISIGGGDRIPRGSLVIGHVLSSNSPQGSTAGPAALEFEFREIRSRTGRVIPVNLYLRAGANFVAAHDATLPNIPPDSDTTSSTTQVGGDLVYPGDKVYSFNGKVVGKANNDGVFAYLRSSESDSGLMCDASDDLQPVGIFSAAACGLYGFSHVTLDQSGMTNPAGVIYLSSDKKSVKIPGGSEALLEVAPGE